MNRIALLVFLTWMTPLGRLGAQDGFDSHGFSNQEGTVEVQAIADSFSGSSSSVVDTLAQLSDNLTPITGNDYVEGALGKEVQTLGGGVLEELPIADGSATLGYAAGGDDQAAADTAIVGTMGGIAGWAAAGLMEELAVEGVITVGAISTPAWVPAVIVGGTVAWATKSLNEWMLHAPTPSPAIGKPTTAPRKPPAAAPTPRSSLKPRPPTRERDSHDRD